MLEISLSGNIKINKGDVFKVPLFIDCSDDIFTSIRLPFKEGDEIYFYIIEPNTSLRLPLLKQTYTKDDINENGDIVLNFTEKDTDWIIPGVYYYEIKLKKASNEYFDSELITIVKRRKFIVM